MTEEGARPEEAVASGLASAQPSRGVLRGLSWSTAGQVASVATSLAVTPFLLTRLGASRYGIVALTASVMGLLSNLDAGINPSCDRYLAVFAGRGDRRRMASFLATAFVLLSVTQGVVALAVAAAAPDIVGLLHGTHFTPSQAVWYLRMCMLVVVAAAWQGLLVRVLRAERRWKYLNIAGTSAGLVYSGTAVVLVALGWGLRGMFVAAAVQQCVALVAFGIPALKALDLRGPRPLRSEDLKAIARFGARAQVAELASSVGYELNTLVVAALFPVSDVAYFAIGSNFSSALASLPSNALGPISTAMGRAFGTGSIRSAIAEFDVLQRRWSLLTASFAPIGAIAAYFGVIAWLGPRDRVAAVVAAVLLVGQWASMTTSLVDILGKVANQPGLESRYLSAGAVLNIALALPLALSIGVVGIPLGIAASQVLSAAYCAHLVGRRVYAGVGASLARVPKAAVAVSCAVTLALELVLQPLVARGPVGLCTCAIPALVGLGVYATTALGPRRALHTALSMRVNGRPQAVLWAATKAGRAS